MEGGGVEDKGCDGSGRMRGAKPVSNLALPSDDFMCLFNPAECLKASGLF